MDDESLSEGSTPSFEQFAAFIRKWAAIPARIEIRPETLFEDDLGITGDDGSDLLEATEDHFRVRLSSPENGYRPTFDLAPHEVLFRSEGFGPDLSDIMSLFGPSVVPTSVRAFRVGELFEAVKNAPSKPIQRQSILGLDA